VPNPHAAAGGDPMQHWCGSIGASAWLSAPQAVKMLPVMRTEMDVKNAKRAYSKAFMAWFPECAFRGVQRLTRICVGIFDRFLSLAN